MTSMREKIARAIYEKRNGRGATPWARQNKSHREPYLADADAALDALMEPTDQATDDAVDEMVKAGAAVYDATPIFQAIIRAAKEGK